MEFEGGRVPTVRGWTDRNGAIERYYHGHDTPIEAYPADSVRMTGIYPGVDAIVRNGDRGMKYDIVIAPGADAGAITFRYIGADRVEQKVDGGLLISTPYGTISEGAPLTWQESRVFDKLRGVLAVPVVLRVPVAARFRVSGSTVTIEIGAHDKTLPVIFDPSLLWSTYYGGGDQESVYSFGNGGAVGKMVDADLEGNVILGGTSRSIDFPTTPGSAQSAFKSYYDAALVAFASQGTRRWATYLGGEQWDLVSGVALDSNRCVAVTGITNSDSFPTTPGVSQRKRNGSAYDLYIAMLDNTGRLMWASYYGGADMEHSAGCAFDDRGHILIGGTTWSTDLPISPGAFQPTMRSRQDAFLVSFDSLGKRRWATYVGGSGIDWGSWVGCDAEGNVSFAGGTESSDFPVSTGAFQTTFGGDRDAFCIQFDSLGRRRWSTLVGGRAMDWAYGIDVDPRGRVAVGGQTKSDNFPTTPGAAQRAIAGTTSRLDGFIVVFDKGGRREWSSYYGGSRNDNAAGIAVAPTGHVYLVGSTLSPDLLQSSRHYDDSLKSGGDFFVAEFDSIGGLVWDTYYGGSGAEVGSGIAGDCFGGVVVAGQTSSIDLPIVGGMQARLNTSSSDPTDHLDLFIARFCNSIDLRPIPDGPVRFCSGDSVTLWAPRGFRHYRWLPSNDTTPSIVVRNSGVFAILVLDSLGCQAVTDTIGVTVHQRSNTTIDYLGKKVLCEGESTMLRGINNGAIRWRWSTGDTTSTLRVTLPGVYTLQTEDTNGCQSTVRSDSIVVLARAAAPVIATSDTIWVCPDSLARLDAGPGYSSYMWSNGFPGRWQWVGVGDYWVRVEDGVSPCSGFSDTVTVALFANSVPSIKGAGTGRLCSGDTIVLDAGSGYSAYRWSTGDSTQTIRVVDSGSFSVVTTTSNGCVGRSDTVTIGLSLRPMPQIRPRGSTNFCDGDSVILEVDGAHADYRWSTGETSASIVVRASGTYSVSVTSVDGCLGDAIGVAVVVYPGPSATIVANGPTTFPLGDSVELEVVGDFAACRWTTGDTTRTISVNTSGAYGAIVTDSNGCERSLTSIDVVAVPPIPDPVAVVTLPDILVVPGERFILPIRFETANLGVNGIVALQGEVRFDRTLATPIGLTPAGWVEGDDRVIPIVLTVQGDTLPHVAFDLVATLGSVVACPLRVVNLIWSGGAVPTTVTPGELRLDGVCTTGSGRLVVADGELVLRPVRPNPVTGEAEIEFEIVEDGPTRLAIVDPLGRVVRMLVDDVLRHGPHVLQVGFEGVPSGSYSLVLTTRADRRSVPVIVVR